jgi:hypothetical protein
MKAIEKKVGFPVRAHMLRHTYGTYTLSALRKSPEFQGSRCCMSVTAWGTLMCKPLRSTCI